MKRNALKPDRGCEEKRYHYPTARPRKQPEGAAYNCGGCHNFCIFFAIFRVIARFSPPLHHPVLVVGGGPAGSTAARQLALAGVPVRVLDKARFPRNKPCGGGISMRVLTRFPYLREPLTQIATHELRRLHLEGPDGTASLVKSDEPAALMIRRFEFDELLVQLAVEAGAELIPEVDVVQVRETADAVELDARDGRRFKSPLVIAADGVHSVVARRLGLNPAWPAWAVALDMMEETPRAQLRDVDPDTLWVAYGYGSGTTGAAPEGYAYIFPKRDHVNIGIGYVLQYYRERVDSSPYDLQLGFIDQLRSRGIVVGESVRKNFTPFLIPVGGPLPETGRRRVILAGDAGGFVNGFTAEGIYYAMVTGDLAARAAVRHLTGGGDLPALYRKSWRHEIGAELRDSVLIQRYLFGDRRRIRAAVDGASRESVMIRLILDFAVGRRSYANLRRAMLARSPVLGARLLWELIRRKRLPAPKPVATI
jgi:geranylgeranyl reductase family protein